MPVSPRPPLPQLVVRPHDPARSRLLFVAIALLWAFSLVVVWQLGSESSAPGFGDLRLKEAKSTEELGRASAELETLKDRVVVLEQGPYLRPFQFRHDEANAFFGDGLIGTLRDHPHSFRASADQDAQPAFFLPNLLYAKAVGGSSLHFSANYWRFRPVDFRERSLLGSIAGTTLADWPLTYEELVQDMPAWFDRIQEFIGVPPLPLLPGTIKQETRRLDQVITNYPALLDAWRGTEWQRFLH